MKNCLGAALLFVPCSMGCVGPERGFVAEFRGRTRVLEELRESERPESESSRVPLFPIFFAERSPDRASAELLWPFFEAGDGGVEGATCSYLRVRPFFARDSFPDRSRLVLFPIYFHVRERLEAGDRSIDHLWPLYGLHREWIDLAPAVTHHFLYPLIYFRHGWNRWKTSIFPFVAASRGYHDRGWWILPLIKWGGHGHSRFFYLVDPLFAYEHDSIADAEEAEPPEKCRTAVRLLGGLLGWENDRGVRRFRALWVLRF